MKKEEEEEEEEDLPGNMDRLLFGANDEEVEGASHGHGHCTESHAGADTVGGPGQAARKQPITSSLLDEYVLLGEERVEEVIHEWGEQEDEEGVEQGHQVRGDLPGPQPQVHVTRLQQDWG